MDLGLSEEQKLLKSSAEKYFENNFSFDDRKKYLEKNSIQKNQWDNFANLGWLGLPFSSKYGGYDGTISDIMVLMETFGRSLVLEPYVNNIILSGKIIEKVIDSEKKLNILNSIIEGKRRISFAFSEPLSRFDFGQIETVALKSKDGWMIEGKKNFVIGSNLCDDFLIPAACKEENDIKFFLISKESKNLIVNSYQNIDNISVADIDLNKTEIKNEFFLGALNLKNYRKQIGYFVDYATLANCSEALGIIDKMYELTLEYVKTREQFGKKIGDFQVIQHRMVDIFIKKEEMRSLNYMAQVNMDKSDYERIKKISLNKIFLGTHAKFIGQECIQLHGGMGVAEEMQIGHYFKRLTTLNTIFGNTDYHYDRYAEANITN